jgi:hypothetical protein
MGDGVNVRGCDEEEARLGQKVWGGWLPVIWGVKLINEKNREMGGPLALDGRHLMWGHNNQPKVAVNSEGGIREETRPGRNVWGTLSHCLGLQMERQKIIIKIHRGLRWPLIDDLLCNNQPKTGFHDGGWYEEEVQ